MKDSCLDTQPLAAYRVWNLTSGTLEEVRDVEYDKTKGSQDEIENLDDVRGIQLSNAMKNMDVGDLRPRQVIDDEDDQVIDEEHGFW
jgi:hypothetical protein